MNGTAVVGYCMLGRWHNDETGFRVLAAPRQDRLPRTGTPTVVAALHKPLSSEASANCLRCAQLRGRIRAVDREAEAIGEALRRPPELARPSCKARGASGWPEIES